MTLCHLFQACFALSVLYKLVSTSKNGEAFQESFIINLKNIKNECDINTANLLAVIDDLQQNENTSLIKDLKKLVEDLKRTVEHQQQTKDYLNETVLQQQQTLKKLRKAVEDQQRELTQQNRTLEEQQSTIHHLNTMIERLNETGVKNLKGKVENLEFGVVAQRLMISKLNESRRPGNGSLTFDNYERC